MSRRTALGSLLAGAALTCVAAIAAVVAAADKGNVDANRAKATLVKAQPAPKETGLMAAMRRVGGSRLPPGPIADGPGPAPGIGLLVKSAEMAALRQKLKTAPWSQMYARLAVIADGTAEEWATKKDAIAPHLKKLWDLSVNNHQAWPKEPETRAAGLALRDVALHGMCPAAFVYLISGEKKYAEAAWGTFEQMAEVNRWGWFPWDGANMPQIEAGMFARNAAFTVDFLWDYLTPAQRRHAREVLAEKVVEPYFRLVLHSPCMGLDHLRSKNQGNNVLSGSLVACLALGPDYPQADAWLRSYVQTFHWIVTHDIGWAGQHLESGMPGYWSVSMQNLYTAATCLANTQGIDLRGHPAFMEATYCPLYHETTVPPVGMFAKPISVDYAGPPGIISGKPIELPHEASCGPWWFDYASRFPQSGALYFINKLMVRKNDAGELQFLVNDCHQEGHAQIIGLLWTRPELYQPQAPQPKDLFKTTDRMTMIRSGFGLGKTYLYVNGDIFLSALNEVLVTSAGLAWHQKWHGWQATESGIQTEDEPLAPSMTVTKSAHDADFSFIRTVSGTSNITYYRPYGQDSSSKHYTRRQRDILYVRGEPGSEYFVFVDRVGQPQPRWHAVLWQTWNHVFDNDATNFGRYRIETPNRVRVERPNADLALDVVAPERVAMEVEGAPGQPIVCYMFDHNLATLRVLAGGYGPAKGRKIAIEPTAWKGTGTVVRGEQLGQDAPAGAYRLSGKSSMVGADNSSKNCFEADAPLEPGQRYRMAIPCRKTDCGVYENLCWEIDLELLDASGKPIAFDRDLQNRDAMRYYNLPGEFRLSDPQSFTKSTPWRNTDWAYFDVPADARVAKIRGTLRAALYSHPPHGITEKSVVELGPLAIEPVGTVQRREDETMVTVAMPLAKGEPAPAIVRHGSQDGTWAKVPRRDGTVDTLVVGGKRPVAFEGGSVTGGLALVRQAGGKVRTVFAQDARAITLAGKELLRSDAPVDLSATLDEQGQIARVRVATTEPAEFKLQGQAVRLDAGECVAGADLRFARDPATISLVSNSPESQKMLDAGLAPLLKKITLERDELTAKGQKNVALGAKVTASAQRDARFPPEWVIDNKTWEYPTAGLLDYTQGPLLTTPQGGYGTGATPLTGGGECPMTSWPFYVRPTYWLLPYQKAGWIQLELAEASPVRTVRLLNTSNAGANDFATKQYRVELLDVQGKVVGRQKGEFGRVLDRPFKAAFMIPEAFRRYGRTFDGMLEPGVKVPFGDGWQTVSFQDAPKAKFVKVYVDSYWALGGGLNEIQVY